MRSSIGSGPNKSIIRRRQVLSSINHWVWGGGAAIPDPGLTYLQENAKLFYDFTGLSGADGAAITTVEDLGPNNRDASNTSPAQAPTITKVVNGVNEYNTFKAFPSAGSKDVLLANAVGNDLFKTSFEVWCVWSSNNNNTVYDLDFCGVGDGATDYFRMTLLSNQFNFQYRYSAGGGKFFFALGPATFYSAFPQGKTLIRFKMDFDADVCKLFHNGNDLALTFNGANTIDTVNPTLFACPTSKFCIGGRNDSGTITARSFGHNQYAFAITPILTNQQAVDVSNYLINVIAE